MGRFSSLQKIKISTITIVKKMWLKIRNLRLRWIGMQQGLLGGSQLAWCSVLRHDAGLTLSEEIMGDGTTIERS
jgi:hypothetical protein